MSTLIRKLTELDDMNQDNDEILTMLTEINDEQLIATLKNRLFDPMTPRGLSIIFNTFCAHKYKKKKVEIMKGILEEIPKQAALTSVQIRDITNAILVELENLDTDSLVKLVSFCTKQMEGDNDSGKEMWKEMLPQLLLLLKEKPVVNHCGHDMSGADYRSQVVKSLCNTDWKSDSITMIAAMFRELPLVGEEFKQVVDKLLDGMKELDASEVPPFIYQMLRLCGNQYFLLVLMHAQKYFKKSSAHTGANTDADSIETVFTDGNSADLHQSESTVLFHIQKCVVQEPQSSRNLASCLTQLAFCPEILFGNSTFLVSSTLMICDVEILREKYMTIAVNSLVRCIQDEETIKQHTWTAAVLASQDQMDTCLKKLIENTDLQRGVILEQFVKFCFEILVNKKTGRAAEVALITVSNALIHVARKQPDAISVILELLVCNLVRSKSDPHLLRCLKKLVAMTPAKLLTKTEFISIKLVEQLVNMQPLMAEQVIVALIPLLSRSEGLTNNLIVNLRKAINRPLVSITKMAISSLLTMIQQLRIKKFNMANSQATQHFSSNSSACSQMTGEITMHGAVSIKDLGAIHLELMQILTPALSCHAEARLRLYEGIHGLPRNHHDLGPIVLNFLFKNLEKCREINGLGVIDYEKCYKETMDEEVILVEPVGHLVFSISMVLCHMKNAKVTDNAANEIDTLLENLVTRMSEKTTTDFGYDKDKTVIEEGAKGEKKVLVCTLAMNVCEAIMAYLVKTWADNKDQLARKIIPVFRTYMSISDHLKGCKRPTKKKDLNATTQGSQQGANANPRKRGRPGSNIAAVKEKGAKEIGGVTIGPVLDLSSLHLMLELLFCETATWADENQASLLRNKPEFNLWVLGSLMQAINHFKVLGSNGVMEKTSPELIYFSHIGKIMFELLSKPAMKELIVDTPEVAILFMESLHELVNLFLLDNHSIFAAFIATTGNGNITETMERHVTRLLKVLGEILSMMENNDDLDQSFKKLPRLTLAILTQMLTLLDNTNPVVEKMTKWLQKAVKDITCEDEQVVKGLLELLLAASELRGRSSAALTAFTKDVLLLLGSIEDNEDEFEKKLALIGESQVNGVIQVICSHIRHTLDLINILIQRLRSERCLHPYQINEECEKITSEVVDKELSVSESLLSILDTVKLLLNAKMGVEQGEALLRDVCALYRTATNYCRHFSKVNKYEVNLRRSKFNAVVTSAGRYLPPVIATFISHLEERQKEKYGEMQGKKKYNAKVAQKRVLRESDTFARTMLENERFSKAVFQLSAKLKDPSLKDSLHMGLCHDFRLNYAELTERLQVLEDEEMSEDGDDANANGDKDDE